MIILPLVIIILFTCFLASIFQISFSKALPTSIFTMISIVYLSGFLNNLMIGICLVSAICVLYIFLIVLNYNNYRKYFFKLILCSNFVLFVAIYLLIMLYTKGEYLVHWDDWTHWAPFAKDLFYRNQFYFNEGHIAHTHLSYPPLQAIFQYMFAKFSNCYIDQNLFRAQLIIVFSLIFPFFDYLNDKKNTKYFFSVILIFALYIASFRIHSENPLYNILPDSTMGFLFTSLMIKSFNLNINNKFAVFDYIVTSIALVLIKQIGVALFLGSYTTLLILQVFDKSIYKKNLHTLILIFIVPMLFIYIWFAYVRICGINDQFDIDKKVSLKSLAEIYLFSGGVPYQKETIANFFLWAKNTRIIFLTYYQWVFLFIICYLSTIVLFFKKYKTRLVVFLSISLFGYFVYTFVILSLYLFCFSEYEATILASIWRYLSSYAISIPLIMCYFMTKESTMELRIFNRYYIITLFITVGLIISILISKQKDYYLPKNIENSELFVNKTDYIILDKAKSGSKILILQENGLPIKAGIFMYNYLGKVHFGSLNVNNDSNKNWDTHLSANEVIELLNKYDYVYPVSADDGFYDRFSSIFNQKLDNRKYLYRIVYDDSKISFAKVVGGK